MKQLALCDPEKQLVSREYLTDLLNPSQTPQVHKLLFLKLVNHLAMHYKLEVIGPGKKGSGGQGRKFPPFLLLAFTQLKKEKELFLSLFFKSKSMTSLFFSKNIFLFLPPSRLHLFLLSFSIWFIHSCVATARSLKKRLARYKRLNEKSELYKVLMKP